MLFRHGGKYQENQLWKLKVVASQDKVEDEGICSFTCLKSCRTIWIVKLHAYLTLIIIKLNWQ